MVLLCSAGKNFGEIARRNFFRRNAKKFADIFSAEIFSRQNIFCRNYKKSRRNFLRRKFWFPFLLVDGNTYTLFDFEYSRVHSENLKTLDISSQPVTIP